jgi:hypothetical protein
MSRRLAAHADAAHKRQIANVDSLRELTDDE